MKPLIEEGRYPPGGVSTPGHGQGEGPDGPGQLPFPNRQAFLLSKQASKILSVSRSSRVKKR